MSREKFYKYLTQEYMVLENLSVFRGMRIHVYIYVHTFQEIV